MKEGEIVKAALTQVDGKLKYRPALLLKQMPPFDDWLVCGITSQIKHEVRNFDLLINEDDTELKETGLLTTSLIRLGFLGVISENTIEGTIGKISTGKYNKLISEVTQNTLFLSF